jgi:tRNA threonylcarbamoyladenosine biosynthesis protein TsaB
MKLLSLETSTAIASVAVVKDGAAAAELSGASNNHSDSLIELVDQALTESKVQLADVDAIVVGAGPGSFTGLRIGMATAKGLAFAAAKPLWAVSSLAALSVRTAKLHPGTLVIALADARRKEVFAGYYRWQDESLVAAAAEEVLKPAHIPARTRELVGDSEAVVIGDAIGLYPELADMGFEVIDASARADAVGIALASAAQGERGDGVATAVPVYIRPSEAEIRFPDGNPGGTFASFAPPPKTRE